MIQLDARKQKIIDFIGKNSPTSNREILVFLRTGGQAVSRITLARDLGQLVAHKLILRQGQGRSVRYALTETHPLLKPIAAEAYFAVPPDSRTSAHRVFDFGVFAQAENIFSAAELETLDALAADWRARRTAFSPALVKKELERLTIELAWKSSQIEGNTYTLLDTELLLKDNRVAAGHTQAEAVMLLNHKQAIEYLLQKPERWRSLTRAQLEELHELLVRDLGVARNLRRRSVGITGTVYRPLDNEFQIAEAVEKLCQLVNRTPHPIAKAFLALALVPYIQPFEDGNKRTSRLACNALLWAYEYCPLSLRSVDEREYKKAVVLLYEQHNLGLMKALFTEQFRFACDNYFR